MAKTAVLLAATMSLVGTADTKEAIKALKGDKPDTDFVEVTAKTFTASEQYPTFKAMCTPPKSAEEIAKEQEVADAKAKEKADKEAAKAKAKEAKIGDAGANKKQRASAGDLTGEYHLTKDLPACAETHAKYPIWVAIAGNTTVETAKAACPAVNPPRATSGVYTFTSEFRYFLKTGYVVMGPAPAEAAAAAAGTGDTAGAAASTTAETAAA